MLFSASAGYCAADPLSELAQFAQSICGDIPSGDLTRTNIQGKIEANAGIFARIVTGDAGLTSSRVSDVYHGVPFDKLPASIPTVAMCKLELIRILKPSLKLGGDPTAAQLAEMNKINEEIRTLIGDKPYTLDAIYPGYPEKESILNSVKQGRKVTEDGVEYLEYLYWYTGNGSDITASIYTDLHNIVKRIELFSSNDSKVLRSKLTSFLQNIGLGVPTFYQDEKGTPDCLYQDQRKNNAEVPPSDVLIPCLA
jgi:hypothetical protein